MATEVSCPPSVIRDPFVAACMVGFKLCLAVSLSILFLCTPLYALEAPPIPDDKIVTPDIANPAANAGLQAACDILDNMPPGVPPPWERPADVRMPSPNAKRQRAP